MVERVGRSGTILVVDDEQAVRDVLDRMLTKSGYSVLTAIDGDDGLRLSAEHEATISAIVLDVTMPRMNGTEFVQILSQINSIQARKVIFTHVLPQVFIGAALQAIFGKPCSGFIFSRINRLL